MPTFVYMTSCDGCGHCVDICPSDIMQIDPVTRRAVNIEPNFCWECYSCVKACPQNAIDVRGYADFAPMGHSVRVLREEDKGTISWKLKFRDGRVKDFVSPIRTTPWGSIKSADEYGVFFKIDEIDESHLSIKLSKKNFFSQVGPPAPIPFNLIKLLEKMASKTYVPESETSRLKGAGAGLTDND